ncbi:GatB/YqeY domain-containing protein [Paenibacillus sp. FSL R7-0302]|uniref:GatB/YqeY domain-containing protein n=1 Tax=Paenibacillus sp. FSL R7-0302 TaxID=2921681 RepID=UPI0030F6B23B
MKIKQRLKADMEQAVRAGDKLRLSVIRSLIDAVQKAEKELLREMDEAEIAHIALKVSKDNKEELNYAIEAAAKESSPEKRVERELRIMLLESQISVIDMYLPKMMDVNEVIVLVADFANNLEAAGQEVNKGNLMKGLNPAVNGKADKAMVSTVVDKVLMERA